MPYRRKKLTFAISSSDEFLYLNQEVRFNYKAQLDYRAIVSFHVQIWLYGLHGLRPAPTTALEIILYLSPLSVISGGATLKKKIVGKT